MSLEHNITAAIDKFFLGEDKIIPGIVFQADGTTRQNITGWVLSWTLEKLPKPSAAPLMVKTTLLPAGGNKIVITNAVQGEYEIRFFDTDTDVLVTTLKPNVEYYHSVKRLDDGTENIVSDGTFEFAGATQR